MGGKAKAPRAWQAYSDALRRRFESVEVQKAWTARGIRTKGEWCERAQVSRTNVNNYLKGKSATISLEIVLALADAAGLDRAWFATGPDLIVRFADKDRRAMAVGIHESLRPNDVTDLAPAPQAAHPPSFAARGEDGRGEDADEGAGAAGKRPTPRTRRRAK